MSEQSKAKRRRRDHSPELKRELIERGLQPGASVSGIALEGGINANLLFKWLREHLRAAQAAVPATPAVTPVLLPVTIDLPMPEATTPPKLPPPPASRASTGSIEIDLGGARIRLRGVVDEGSIRVVLQALRAPRMIGLPSNTRVWIVAGHTT